MYEPDKIHTLLNSTFFNLVLKWISSLKIEYIYIHINLVRITLKIRIGIFQWIANRHAHKLIRTCKALGVHGVNTSMLKSAKIQLIW